MVAVFEPFSETIRSSMPILNENYWEERYRTGDMPWEKGAASPGLVDFLQTHPALPRGTVWQSVSDTRWPRPGSGHARHQAVCVREQMG